MWLKRNASSPPIPSASGCTSSFRISSWRLAPDLGPLRIRARGVTTASQPKTRPITAARWTIARSRGASRSSRADSSASIEGGITAPPSSTSASQRSFRFVSSPSSISIRSISSTKSGLPSAAATTFAPEIPGDVLAEQVGDEQLALLRAERLEDDRARVRQRGRPRRHASRRARAARDTGSGSERRG